MHRAKNTLVNICKKSLHGKRLFAFCSQYAPVDQVSKEFLDWINTNIAVFAEEFVAANKLAGSPFIKKMNMTFNTTRFELLLKRRVVEYIESMFFILGNYSKFKVSKTAELPLEDTPLNRFVLEKFYSHYRDMPKINWLRQPLLISRIGNILLTLAMLKIISLKNGVRLFEDKKEYKVMREAIWGLYDVQGQYLHDNFFVDGKMIKDRDLLLFSRGIPEGKYRIDGYNDARKSPYEHFDLNRIPVGLKTFFLRAILKYIICGGSAMLRVSGSKHYALFSDIFLNFCIHGIPYERVFSSYKVGCEFGHNFFTPFHIAEAIVCQGHGTKYYLMHWSDLSGNSDRYFVSFLGCDKYLIWGDAHKKGFEGREDICLATGFVFKGFINEVSERKPEFLSKMGIEQRGRITSFFDESFGGTVMMTGSDYVDFWQAAKVLGQKESAHTVLIRSKDRSKCNKLPQPLMDRFLLIKAEIEKLSNVHIIDEDKWSFIEVIGVSDVAVTQGMTSSSIIALICGKEGLYYDKAHYDHPISRLFKDKLVFDEEEKLIAALSGILNRGFRPSMEIPEDLMRKFDAYSDDRGLDRFRQVLVSGNMVKKILITGASGFIGGLLYKKLAGKGAVGVAFKISDQDNALGIKDIDLRNEAAVKEMMQTYSPDTIYHFAALVVPRINEENPELARQSHIEVTANILKFMKKDAHVIFLSTDKVFDGSQACPGEDSKPAPTSLYGKLKLEAENMVRSSAQRHHLFRLPIVHGNGDPRSTSFVDKSLISLKAGQSISAFTNIKRCYIKIDDLIELLIKSADNEQYGVYHVGCDMASYYDRIAKMCLGQKIKTEGLLQKGEGNVVPPVQDLNRDKAIKTFGINYS